MKIEEIRALVKKTADLHHSPITGYAKAVGMLEASLISCLEDLQESENYEAFNRQVRILTAMNNKAEAAKAALDN